MITIGSRGSQLALWQARWVESQLTALGATCCIEIIRTTGDKVTDVPLAKVGGKGLFTKEIEDALLAGSVDLAVHSLKDMPTELPEGLALQAVPEREDVRDALVGRKLTGLPAGARVGTSSLRRSAQLRYLRPDLVIENIRGNLDTRLRKLDEGQFDAIVLAAAGLRRLGWADRIAELLPEDVCCPAVGQGALAIETRDDEGVAALMCRKLNHKSTRLAVTAERALLGSLGGGCQVPIGAHATVADGRLRLRAVVAAPDGSNLIAAVREGASDDAAAIGSGLGQELLANGAREILEAVYGPSY
jgi:hydroxymethylbilane synthase